MYLRLGDHAFSPVPDIPGYHSIRVNIASSCSQKCLRMTHYMVSLLLGIAFIHKSQLIYCVHKICVGALDLVEKALMKDDQDSRHNSYI